MLFSLSLWAINFPETITAIGINIIQEKMIFSVGRIASPIVTESEDVLFSIEDMWDAGVPTCAIVGRAQLSIG